MSEDSVAATAAVRPYPPSWLDRLTAWVDRLPMPAPAFYALAGAGAFVLFILNEAVNGLGLVDATRPFHIVLALGPIYAVALVHFLDHEADHALEKIKPLLTCDESGYAVLRYRLTTIPPRGALLAGLAGMLVGLVAVIIERVALPRAFSTFTLPGAGRSFIEVWLIGTWFVFGGLFYHTVHQLRQISLIYTTNTRIDLDQYRPLFSFSRVSALTAIGLLLLPYGWYATVPGLIQEPIGIAGFGALFPIFAVIAFVGPLVGVHHLLVDAKEHTLTENAQRAQSGPRGAVSSRNGQRADRRQRNPRYAGRAARRAHRAGARSHLAVAIGDAAQRGRRARAAARPLVHPMAARPPPDPAVMPAEPRRFVQAVSTRPTSPPIVTR